MVRFEKINIIDGMPDSEYHARTELSKSSLEYFGSSPLKYWYNYLNPEGKPERKETPALILGKAIHTAVLEPHLVESEIVRGLGIPRRSKADKEAHAEFEAKNQGKLILSPDDYLVMQRVTDACVKHPLAKHLLGMMLVAEQTALYTANGTPMKSRFDGVLSNNVLLDLKTTDSAHPDAFKQSIRKYGYDMQAYIYVNAYKACYGHYPDDFVFLAVEKKPPFCVAVYNISAKSFKYCADRFETLLTRYDYSMKNNYWPDYNENKLTTLEI